MLFQTDGRRIVTIKKTRENQQKNPNRLRETITIIIIIIMDIIMCVQRTTTTVSVCVDSACQNRTRRERWMAAVASSSSPSPPLLKIVRAAAVHSWCGCGKPVARRRGQETFARRPVGCDGPARARASAPRTRPPPFSLMGTPTRAPQVRVHTRTINNVKKGSPETTTPPA